MERGKVFDYKSLVHAEFTPFLSLPRNFCATFSASFHEERGNSMLSFCCKQDKLSYSIRQACEASSLGRTTIYSHIAAGRLKAIRIGGRTVISAESLRALVNGDGDGHDL
jgi:excisionase family DNA binding protein